MADTDANDGSARVIPFAPKPAPAKAPDLIGSLPFVRTLDEPLPDRAGRHFWSPELKGLEYRAANRVGYAYAFRCIEAMAATDFTPF